MKNRYIVAVDQSTSATKACLFGKSGEIVKRATVEHKQYYPQPGWVEHDAEEILENTESAISRVVAEAGIDTKGVAALAITNQRETIVAWDSQTGKPVHHALVWQDERGTAACRALLERGAGEEIQRRTGLVVDTYFSASEQAAVDGRERSRLRSSRGGGHPHGGHRRCLAHLELYQPLRLCHGLLQRQQNTPL